MIGYGYWTTRKLYRFVSENKATETHSLGNVIRTSLEWNTDGSLVTESEETKQTRESGVHWFQLKIILIKWGRRVLISVMWFKAQTKYGLYVNTIINFSYYVTHQQVHIIKIYFVLLYISIHRPVFGRFCHHHQAVIKEHTEYTNKCRKCITETTRYCA